MELSLRDFSKRSLRLRSSSVSSLTVHKCCCEWTNILRHSSNRVVFDNTIGDLYRNAFIMCCTAISSSGSNKIKSCFEYKSSYMFIHFRIETMNSIQFTLCLYLRIENTLNYPRFPHFPVLHDGNSGMS